LISNSILPVKVPEDVVTLIKPVVAPAGTVASIKDPETTLKTAAVPSKATAVAPARALKKLLYSLLEELKTLSYRRILPW
jgi:hypothetical protein